MRSEWTTVAGLRMHARVWEREDLKKAPAVVLLHGLGMSSRYTIPTANLLAKEMRVFAPELPGFGLSEKPRRPLDVPELARFLASWTKAVGLERVTFVGNSFGCQIIAQLAASDPRFLWRAVMIAPTVEPAARTAWRQVMRLAHTALIEPLGLVSLASVDYLRAGPWRVWRTFKFALADRIEEKLAHTKAPTLVIRGGRDPLVSARWAAEATEILPRGRLISIPRAAHAVYYNSPHELSQIISEFVFREDEAQFVKHQADVHSAPYGT